MLSGRRIELWVESRDGAAAVNPVMRALLRELAAEGASVFTRVPEYEVIDLSSRSAEERRPDLVLLKTATTLALSLAVADEAGGMRFLNDARKTLRAHDKAAVVTGLAAAGVPVPESYLFDSNDTVTPPEADAVWVTKPARGVHGRGVTVHPRSAATLDTEILSAGGSHVVDDGTRLLQRHVGVGADLKVYAAGENLFAGFKAFGSDSYATNTVDPTPLDASTAEVVRGAGEALGLRLFGVDLRLENGSPVTIDVNPFPGYRGFPEAVPVLRAEIERALGEEY